jgi:Ca-activated chloride channel family protein
MLWLAALLSGVLAPAGPRRAQAGEHIASEGIAIMLAVDVSGSMAEKDFDWHGESVSRLEAVKRCFEGFVRRRPQDQLGLVLFAAQPDTACPLTMDHTALSSVLMSAEPRGVPTESETNIGDALAWSLARLRSYSGKKTILLCSDGEHNVAAPALLPRQAAQLAAASGIFVDTVFAGPTEGPGRDALQTIAQMTGGTFLEAQDAEALLHVVNVIDQLQRDRNVDSRRLKYTEWYPFWSLMAVGLVAAAFVYTHGPGRVLP